MSAAPARVLGLFKPFRCQNQSYEFRKAISPKGVTLPREMSSCKRESLAVGCGSSTRKISKPYVHVPSNSVSAKCVREHLKMLDNIRGCLTQSGGGTEPPSGLKNRSLFSDPIRKEINSGRIRGWHEVVALAPDASRDPNNNCRSRVSASKLRPAVIALLWLGCLFRFCHLNGRNLDGVSLEASLHLHFVSRMLSDLVLGL